MLTLSIRAKGTTRFVGRIVGLLEMLIVLGLVGPAWLVGPPAEAAAASSAPRFLGFSAAGAAGLRASGDVEWLAGGLIQGDWRAGERGFGVAGATSVSVPSPGSTQAGGESASWRGDVFGWGSYGKALGIVGTAGAALGGTLSWEGGRTGLALEALCRAAVANVAGELRLFARPAFYRAPVVVPEAVGYANGLFAALADPSVGGRYGTGTALAFRYRASRELSVGVELAGYGPSPVGTGLYAVPNVGRFSASVQLGRLLPGTISAGASATISRASGLQPGVMVGYRDVIGEVLAVSARVEWTGRAEAEEAWGGNLTAVMPLGETGIDILGQFDLKSRQGIIGFRGGF